MNPTAAPSVFVCDFLSYVPPVVYFFDGVSLNSNKPKMPNQITLIENQVR